MASSETRGRVFTGMEGVRGDGRGTGIIHDGRRTETDTRSLGDLFRELSLEGRTLVQQEIQLAKTEIQEKMSIYASNSITMAVGGALLLVALMAVGTAVIYGLIVLLDLFLPFELAVWLAPLLFGAVVAFVGWRMISKGKQTLANEGLAPQRTLDTLREDKDWMKSKVR